MPAVRHNNKASTGNSRADFFCEIGRREFVGIAYKHKRRAANATKQRTRIRPRHNCPLLAYECLSPCVCGHRANDMPQGLIVAPITMDEAGCQRLNNLVELSCLCQRDKFIAPR